MTDTFTPNSLAWFEVATEDPDTATAFYADLFGWTFASFADPEVAGADYRVATLPGNPMPFGGVAATDGETAGHAIFYIAVTNVAACCDKAERLGGEVVTRDLDPPAGPAFAYLRDSVGSLFGVFTPRA
jgi:predicted enzyme related to lactoylglutathione lyase